MPTLLAALLLASGMCLPRAAEATPELTTGPVKWFDADDRPIPEPAEIEENQIWDIADHTFFFQVGKVLDLGWSARRVGNLLGVVGPRQADNVNALDEVPNSSWYTNRHFPRRMSLEELAEGPGFARPDDSGPWEIVAGKFEGGTAGFTIKDASGQYYLLKFDSEGNNEMGSAAEAIATKVLHAAGYNVPRNSVVHFDPALLEIGPKARVPTGDGSKRPMTPRTCGKSSTTSSPSRTAPCAAWRVDSSRASRWGYSTTTAGARTTPTTGWTTSTAASCGACASSARG